MTSDLGDNLSRISYTVGRLSTLSKEDNVEIAIQRFIDISMNPRQAVNDTS